MLTARLTPLPTLGLHAVLAFCLEHAHGGQDDPTAELAFEGDAVLLVLPYRMLDGQRDVETRRVTTMQAARAALGY